MTGNGPIRKRWLTLVWAVGCLVVSAWAQQSDWQDDLRVIEGLRQRRMFDLAERLCEQWLADRDLDPTTEVTFVLEQIRTRVSRAVVAPADRREAAWQAVAAAANDFLTRHPDHPRRLLVQVQAALAHQTHGNLLVQEIAAEMAPATAREQALSELRTATRQLRQIETDIDRALRQQRGGSAGEHDLSTEQLLNLKRNLRFQDARTNLFKAQLYPPDDRLNRIDTLTLVNERLEEVLKQANPDQPLWWDARTAEIRSRILLGQYDLARRLIEQLPEEQRPLDARAEVLELEIELAIASGLRVDPNRYVQRVQQLGAVPPSLDLAVLKLLLSEAKAAGEAEQQQWLERATRQTADIEASHGGYWGRRAELVLIRRTGADAGTGPASASANFELLLRVGDDAQRKNRWEDAIEAYRQALQVATQGEQPELKVLAAVRLARSHEQQDQHRRAAEILVEVARQHPELPSAAAAHLRGCWNAVQGVSEGSRDQVEGWVESLREHIRQWPDAATADQARLWLAGHQQRQSKWQAAILTYLGISAESSQIAAAARQISVCFQRYEQKEDDSIARRQVAGQITGVLEQKLSALNRSGDELLAETCALRLLWAEIGLVAGVLDPEPVVAQLEALVQATSDQELTCRQQAQAWRVVALASDPARREAALGALQELPNEPSLMRICRRGFRALADRQSDRNGPSLAKLRLTAADKALVAEQDADEIVTWQLEQARAVQEQGQLDRAIELLSQLAAERPRSLEIRLRLGRALTEQDVAAAETLKHWRQIAAQVKPHTEPWYEAKYEVARSLGAAGQREQAIRMLKYLRAIPPGWSQSSRRAEFEQLLKDLERQLPRSKSELDRDGGR